MSQEPANRDAPLSATEVMQLGTGGGRHRTGERPAAREVLVSGPEDREPRVVVGRQQNGWSLTLPEQYSWGLPATAGGDVTGDTIERVDAAVIVSHCPNLTDYLPYPKVEGRYRPPVMRRRNGRRVNLHGYIFDRYDRYVFDPGSTYPWRCAGKLLVWNDPNSFYWDPPSSEGSAALVGPNIVLTSSHSVPDQSKWRGIFLPGFYDGRTSFGLFSFVETWRRYNPYDQGSDLAILKLYSGIGDTLGWFGARVYRDDWEDGNYWRKIGYAGDIAGAQKPSFTGPFPIVDDDDSYGVELEYKADASEGDSGGPIYGHWDDGPYIVGAHSGSEEEFNLSSLFVEKNNLAAGGPALTDLISWGYSNW